jgi:hypothetical protein
LERRDGYFGGRRAFLYDDKASREEYQIDERGVRVKSFHAVALALLAATPAIVDAGTSKGYSPAEKAYYADAQAVQFVRPGLTIKILSAKIASDGTITVVYTITDPAGLPLDNTGVATPGVVNLSFVAAVLPNNQTQYTSYTTRVATGAAIATTTQAGADTGGAITALGGAISICLQYQGAFEL